MLSPPPPQLPVGSNLDEGLTSGEGGFDPIVIVVVLGVLCMCCCCVGCVLLALRKRKRRQIVLLDVDSIFGGGNAKLPTAIDNGAEPIAIFGGSDCLDRLRRLLTDLCGAGATLGVYSDAGQPHLEALLQEASLIDLVDPRLVLGGTSTQETSTQAANGHTGREHGRVTKLLVETVAPLVHGPRTAPQGSRVHMGGRSPRTHTRESQQAFSPSRSSQLAQLEEPTVEPSADGTDAILLCTGDPGTVHEARHASPSVATLLVARGLGLNGRSGIDALLQQWAGGKPLEGQSTQGSSSWMVGPSPMLNLAKELSKELASSSLASPREYSRVVLGDGDARPPPPPPTGSMIETAEAEDLEMWSAAVILNRLAMVCALTKFEYGEDGQLRVVI